MLSYYATFSEVTKNDNERRFLSNVKSVADVVSFVLGFALLPVFVGFMNIRIVVLLFFPLTFLIIIALFLLKEKKEDGNVVRQKESLIDSFAYTMKNTDYVIWMGVFAIMTIGIQLFLTGQNVYLSGIGLMTPGSIALINACAFAPVPFTIMLYNRFVKKRGLRFGFIWAMGTFALGMIICSFCNKNIVENANIRLIIAICGALVCSLGIGTFFSVNYLVPSHVAAREKQETGFSQPSMYFAVQGLVGGIATGIATGLIWVNLKNNATNLLMPLVFIFMLSTAILALFLPKKIALIGKENKITTPIVE
jgi:Na+/melibiose symporter-like transporter